MSSRFGHRDDIQENLYECKVTGTNGVSSRAPVSGAFGVCKVHLKFRPVRKKNWCKIAIALTLYSIFTFLIFMSYSWSKPSIKIAYTLPVLRTVYAGMDALKAFLFQRARKKSLSPRSG